MPSLWADTLDEHRRLVLGRLLDAYGELHAERSFEGITLAAVAERAGIARSAVYNYVADKHDLALAYTERALADVVSRMVEDVQAAGGPRERIAAYVRWTLRHHAEVQGAGDDLMPVLSPEQQGRLFEMLAPLRDLLEETVALGLAEGVFDGDPEVLALLVWSTLGGLRMPVATGQLDPERTADQVTAVLLDGMCRR
jgi:AcrR family transcriptional regulator